MLSGRRRQPQIPAPRLPPPQNWPSGRPFSHLDPVLHSPRASMGVTGDVRTPPREIKSCVPSVQRPRFPDGFLVPESGMKGARCRSKRPPPVAFARAIFVALDRCVRQGPATARLGIGSQAQESGLSCRRRTETKMRVCRPLAKSAMVNRSPSCVKPAWLKVTSTFRGDRHICAVA